MKNRIVARTILAAAFAGLIGLASNSHANTVTASWNAVTTDTGNNAITVSGYQLYQSTVSFIRGGVWISTQAATRDGSVTKINVAGTATSTALNLSAGTYFYRLTAYDSAGESGFNVDSSGLDVQVSTTVLVALLGDLNGDGAVNILDVQLDINAALNPTLCTAVADVNHDSACNVLDVQTVVNKALGL